MKINYNKNKVLRKLFFPKVCILIFVLSSCSGSDCLMMQPDYTKFNNAVTSVQMQSDLRKGIITPGMPVYVARNILKNCLEKKGMPVCSFGSRLDITEPREYGSVVTDPNNQRFLDTYTTTAGDLYIWSGNENFFSRKVNSGDRIILFRNDRTDTAKVLFMTGSESLCINTSLDNDIVPFIEIKDSMHPERYSYFYDADLNDSLVTLSGVGKDFYPIYQIELENKKINSFKYKK